MSAIAEVHRGRVTSPFSLEEHDLEDLEVSRVLHEACYFKCPDTGNEFEIVVRKRVPDPGLEQVAEETPPPPSTEDEPETMGGEDFSDMPPEDEPEDEDVEGEDDAGEEEDEDEEETTEESAASTVLGLMAEGLSASAALDLVEMCGAHPEDLGLPRQLPQPDPAMVFGMGSEPTAGGGLSGFGAQLPRTMMPGEYDDEAEEVPVYGDRKVDLEDV